MDFDAIAIGGGHAGIEAGLALARLGFKTLFITQNLDCIAKLSCNPAIGGLAKGNVVREIDALGGQMARLIDSTMIQFRILNRSKGPAVQAPRAQADKAAYALLAKQTLEQQKNLSLFQDTVVDLICDGKMKKIKGVVTERGNRITAGVVVLTTGTFMEARIFIGDYMTSSGRLGEPAAVGLGESLRKIGFEVGRLKTGTPARVLKSSLDFSRLEEQKGDEIQLPFSFSNHRIERPHVPCYITYTTEATHKIIRDNIKYSPLYGGKIVGIGPRYCPSIEDKVMRFPDRGRHQIFVEPEGLNTEEMYLNGISSSLPEQVQERFLRTVPGLERVVIMKPGYAVEYDYINPTQLYPNLESKLLQGLFIAGQTNGTSGYEEAAAQGLLAGINAALKLQKKKPLILSRAESYIGVLIDDLVTLGTKEPYRLFTSRAEYRLCLRHDTADMRLFSKGYAIGLQNNEANERFEAKVEKLNAINELLHKRKVDTHDISAEPLLSKYKGKTFARILKDPAFTMSVLKKLDGALNDFSAALSTQIELDIKYAGYLKRQQEQVARFKRLEKLIIPSEFNYDSAKGLSKESREKLKTIRPLSVGQASRISGVRNSDIAVLLVYLTKKSGA
ncbi:MAG: tRNA uridine-5-carboxymethylaminomethyl(34) synthesis enzyme MnmG [Spirochaetales bacterium]|nr:tRNA uridine-5-carboxymethylaminomethyl(34) synthesis enzyme MnmG [Spirochaetales bacterium]